MTLFITSCSPVTVDRDVSEENSDLSGRWNDNDTRIISEKLVEKILESDFARGQEKRPVLTFDRIENKTMEHLETDAILKNIERQLLLSGKFDFVASGASRTAARIEKKDYEEHNSGPAGTRIIVEKKADYIVKGYLHSLVDQLKDDKIMYYQLTVELISVDNNRLALSEQAKIKKKIQKSSITW
mgnify:CR=1 FL=1